MLTFIRPLKGIIGHRGTRGTFFENTLKSFALTKAGGANSIEFDVKLSKDDKMMIIHDDTVDRTTNGKGNVRDLSFDQLRALDAGENEVIPTLEETLALADSLKLSVNIEIKDTHKLGLELTKKIAKLLNADKHSHSHTLVSSFDHNNLLLFRELCPSLPIGFLVEQASPEIIPMVQSYDNATLNIGDNKDISVEQIPSFIAPYLNKGLILMVYTVNDPIRAKAYLDSGVFAIFTDYPGKMLSIL